MPKPLPRKINNHKLGIPSTIELGEKLENQEESPVSIVAYTGNKVDLSDYGIDHPVVYNTAGIHFKNKIPFLYNHWEPIGHVENIRLDSGKIVGEGVFSFPGDNSKKISVAVQNKFPLQSSMGLEIQEDDVTFVADGVVQVNNQTFEAPIYVVNKAQLVEQSAVLFGRDSDTTITKLSKETLMKIIKNSVPPTPPTDPAPPTIPAPVKKVDNAMVFRLMRLAGDDEKLSEIVINGLDNDWDEARIVDSVKLHKLEHDYPRPPSPGKPDEQTGFANQLLARMALSLNVSEEFLTKKFDEKTYDNAFKKGPMGLKEMITVVANANGGNFSGHSDILEACRYLKRINNNMQYSTIVFPNLLERVTQFRMEERWTIGEPWAPKFLFAQSQNNFKPTGRIRPSGGQMWDELDKDGRIKLGSGGEEKTYETRLRTIAQMLTFKRSTIIDDDLGVIEEMMLMMIEGATMAPDFMFVNKLYNGINTGFLSTANDNVAFGVSAAFSETSLRNAYNKVRTHNITKGNKTVKTNFDTRWVLVIPQSLEEAAWELIRQSRLISPSNDDRQGDQNYWYNRVDIETFMNLDNNSYHPNAASNVWGLMPKKPMLAPWSITYLNNQRKPTTELVDLDADMLGFGIRGYWDLDINEREEEAVFWNFPSLADPA